MNTMRIAVFMALLIAQQSYCRSKCTPTWDIICPDLACSEGEYQRSF